MSDGSRLRGGAGSGRAEHGCASFLARKSVATRRNGCSEFTLKSFSSEQLPSETLTSELFRQVPLPETRMSAPVPNTLKIDSAHRATPRDMERFVELVRGAAECAKREIGHALEEAGLSETRFRVLHELHASVAHELSQTALAGRLGLSESNLSSLIDRMHADGLLERERAADDRRKTLVRLTSDGTALWTRANAQHKLAMRRLAACLEGEELPALNRLLEAVLPRLERAVRALQPAYAVPWLAEARAAING